MPTPHRPLLPGRASAPRSPAPPSRRGFCAALCGGAAWLHGLPAYAVQAYATAPRGPWPANASPQARQVAQWATASTDHQGLPFAIIDKPQALLHLFSASGTWLDSTPVLIGQAHGDHTVPGIGERPLAQIRPHERTTPAGRFASEPGRNTQGHDLVWIDYDSALSLHRVRSLHPRERRLQRLASPDARERRISNGCVNVPHDFYDAWIAPTLGQGHGVVYVLPDTLPLTQVFPSAARAHFTR